MHEGESFEIGTLTWKPLWKRLLNPISILKRRFRQKLVLTDQRIITFKRGWFTEYSDDFLLDDISSIAYRKGVRAGNFHIEGPGYEEEFSVPKGEGQDFASETRRLQQESKARA